MFYKKGVLRNFAKFTGKYLCQSLFNKVAGLRPVVVKMKLKRVDIKQVFLETRSQNKNKTLLWQNFYGLTIFISFEQSSLLSFNTTPNKQLVEYYFKASLGSIIPRWFRFSKTEISLEKSVIMIHTMVKMSFKFLIIPWPRLRYRLIENIPLVERISLPPPNKHWKSLKYTP